MAKDDEKKEDEKLVPVGDGLETSDEEESKKPAKADTEDSDEKVGHRADDDDDEDSSEDDGEGELSPERRRLREKRRQAKIRKTARVASDRRELEFLRKRNDDVERMLSKVVLRQDQQEVVVIDGRISALEGQIREAETIHAQAVEAKDGATATEALRVKDALRDALNEAKGSKKTQQAKAKESEETTRTAPQRKVEADPEAVSNGKQWLSENDWFDPQLTDEDSYIARAIEERLAREGRFDPRDPDYWEELDKRITKRMPHLKTAKSKSSVDEDIFEEDDEKPKPKPKKPGGPRIAIGGKTRSLKPNEVFLSSQRIEALKQAGVWDDPEKKERYLRSYKKYDEEAAQRNS